MLSYIPPWSWDPVILLVLGLTVLGYVYGYYELHRRRQLKRLVQRGLIRRTHPCYFAAGLILLALALISPLDTLAEMLFSMHMIQHVLLLMLAPPLLLLGVPAPMVRLLILEVNLRGVLDRLTHPFVAYALYNTNLLVWHLPSAYEAALRNRLLHDVEHALFFYTALFFWWRVIDPSDGWFPISRWPPAKWVYLLVAAPPSYFLGSVFWASNEVLYPFYAALPDLWGMSALQDQQYGGLIMWIQGWMFAMISIGVYFAWYRPEAQPE